MSLDKLRELVALSKVTTPGPWKGVLRDTRIPDDYLIEVVFNHDDAVIFWTGFNKSDAPKADWWHNAEFIAAARNSIADLESLLSRHEALKAAMRELEALEAELRDKAGPPTSYPERHIAHSTYLYCADRLHALLERHKQQEGKI